MTERVHAILLMLLIWILIRCLCGYGWDFPLNPAYTGTFTHFPSFQLFMLPLLYTNRALPLTGLHFFTLPPTAVYFRLKTSYIFRAVRKAFGVT